MKSIVRVSVLTLAFAGALAGAFTTNSSNNNAKVTPNVMAVSAAFPIPFCPPNAPNGCGIPLK